MCLLTMQLGPVFELSRAFSGVTVPLEYGANKAEKLSIGSKITHCLIEKLLNDLRIGIPTQHIDCVYYMTIYEQCIPPKSMI